jgi:cytochrome c2
MRKSILVLVTVVCAATLSFVYSAAKEAIKGKEAFQEKCSQCHSVTKVDTAHLGRDNVEACVARMAKKPGADIKAEDFDNIEDYLLGYITVEKPRNLFVAKCTQCHSMECTQAGLTSGDTVRKVVKEMAGKPSAEITEEEAQNIEDYLLDFIKAEKKNVHQVLFEAKCSQCHGLEKVKAGHMDADKAKEVVERMAKKPKADINPEDFSNIEDYLLEYIKK